MKLSPLFRFIKHKPIRNGVYRVKCYLTKCETCSKDKYYSYFDGEKFNGMWETIQRAEINKNKGDISEIGKWQGIIK